MLPAVDTEQLKLDKPVSIAGFYLPKKKEENKAETLEQSVEKLDLNCAETQSEAQDETKVETSQNTDSENENLNESKNSEGEEEEVDENNNEENEEEDDDDGEGWITPSNLEKAKKMSRVESEQQEINNMELKVACMTSDFAMQVCFLLLIAFNCY